MRVIIPLNAFRFRFTLVEKPACCEGFGMRLRVSICLAVLTVATSSSSINAQVSLQQAPQPGTASAVGTATTAAPKPATRGYDAAGRQVMRMAMQLSDQGDAAGAARLARTAQRMPVQWKAGEETPTQFIDSYVPPEANETSANWSDVIPITTHAQCASTQPVCPPSARFAEPQQSFQTVETCDWCKPRGIWMEAEYMFWWVREPNVAPLVTTSVAGTPESEAGVLGLASTRVIGGSGRVLDTDRSGARLTLGYSLEPHFDFLMSYTTIGGGSDTTTFDVGDGILARPFDNLTLGNDSEIINFPGLSDGTITVDADVDIETFEMLFRRDMGWIRNGFIDASVGYRYMSLHDHLSIREQSTALAGAATAGTVTDLLDQFLARNTFHGATFGLSSHWHHGDRWTLELNGKLSYGNSRRIVTIAGATTTTDAGGAATTNSGGLLAQDSNIGVYRDNKLTYIAELGLVAKYQVNDRSKFTIGYNLLHFDKVLRAGNQLDLTVNTTQIAPGTLVGAALPTYSASEEELLAHALRLGFEYEF